MHHRDIVPHYQWGSPELPSKCLMLSRPGTSSRTECCIDSQRELYLYGTAQFVYVFFSFVRIGQCYQPSSLTMCPQPFHDYTTLCALAYSKVQATSGFRRRVGIHHSTRRTLSPTSLQLVVSEWTKSGAENGVLIFFTNELRITPAYSSQSKNLTEYEICTSSVAHS